MKVKKTMKLAVLLALAAPFCCLGYSALGELKKEAPSHAAALAQSKADRLDREILGLRRELNSLRIELRWMTGSSKAAKAKRIKAVEAKLAKLEAEKAAAGAKTAPAWTFWKVRK